MKLVDGTIVILSRYPGKKWITHYGWYTYNSQQYMGWYFSSIPGKTCIPINDADLIGIVIVSQPGECPCPPGPGPCPPFPPGPIPPIPPGPDIKTPDARAFISVDKIAERDALKSNQVCQGKIVRVNYDDEGNPDTKYYECDLIGDDEEIVWRPIELGGMTEDERRRLEKLEEDVIRIDLDLSDRYTKEEVDALLDNKADASELSEFAESVNLQLSQIQQQLAEDPFIYVDEGE